MKLSALPFFEALEESHNVLLAGMGGGFDVYCAVPLMLALKAAGKTVHLANYSFSKIQGLSGVRRSPEMLEVTADTKALSYFPERELCVWFRDIKNMEVSVHCFDGNSGVVPLSKSYAALVDAFEIDAVVLVDGGTDALMRGDEHGLGTPGEDAASLAAAFALPVELKKLLLCVGFGIDTFHGVRHVDFLEAVAALQSEGAFLGAFSMLPEMPEVESYLALVKAVHKKHRYSIVNGSMVSSLESEFGDVHRSSRTAGSELFINPLMSVAWGFSLPEVAKRNLYLSDLQSTNSLLDINARIRAFRKNVLQRPKRNLPM